jgi:RNA polymerase sigma factor (sigma-70 family)
LLRYFFHLALVTQPENINKLTDRLFRHQSGKMISVLVRIFGTENFEAAEDVVQNTFMEALNVWKFKGIPENPEAWLFKVAKNKAIDFVRRNKFSMHYDFNDPDRALLKSEYTLTTVMDQLLDEEIVKDDSLRMMYACCHPEINEESQLTLILKTVCGFSTIEIARAFLTNEETITKRLYRTKEFFRARKIKPEIPSVESIKQRTASVLNAIYLLFNEGYNSTQDSEFIRNDLILEALALAKLLTENKHTNLPETFALVALICFHSARSDSRTNSSGEIILLADQDRSQWNQELINLGNDYMNRAATGDSISTYHLEAAIAYEHCIANDFSSTNWKRILELYDWLIKLAPSPVKELNKSAVILQLHGPLESLKYLEAISSKEKLENYYLFNSLLGEINLLLNRFEVADNYFSKAIQMTRSEAEKKLLNEKRKMVRMRFN